MVEPKKDRRATDTDSAGAPGQGVTRRPYERPAIAEEETFKAFSLKCQEGFACWPNPTPVKS